MPDMQQPPNNFTGNNAPVIELLRSLVEAVNNLNNTFATVFPSGGAIVTSAGAATGEYLTITAANGVTYKIPLLAES